ncbi:hypothetical protein NDU88_000587 [Pleurodeles waltl]|uniref:Uncharacterized protein n=1 Tax=Pleurodeles waltl TaxID=8319 RepID=A0AAV7U7K5_PLEWA|nr:hypothetical protein NDU88_000587 [Pleurodeles waltl]
MAIVNGMPVIEHVNQMVQSYRATIHDTSKYIPFELLRGREPKTMLVVGEVDMSSKVDGGEIEKNIKKNQEKYESWFDKKKNAKFTHVDLHLKVRVKYQWTI